MEIFAAPAGGVDAHRARLGRLPAPALLTGVALMLGLLGLSTRSIWLDEGFTVGVTTGSPGEFLADIPLNGGNMLLYYAVMAGWVRVGLDEWLLRMPSLAFAVATVPVLYALATRLSSRRVATIAAGLTVCSVPFLAAAQEARSYSLFVLLVVAGWLLQVEAVHRGSWRLWAGFVGVMVLATYAHYYAPLFFAAQLASLAALPRRTIPARWIAAGGAAFAALTAPVVLLAFAPSSVWPAWIAPLGWAEAAEVAGYMSGGRAGVVATAFLLAAGAGALLSMRQVRPRSFDAWHAAVPVAWLVVPVAIAVAGSVTVQPLLVGRYLAPAVPAVMLLVARAARSLGPAWRPAHLLAVAVLAASAVPGVVAHYESESEDWRGASTYLFEQSREDDAVVLVGGSRALVEYYWHMAGRPVDVAAPIFPTGSWDRPRRWYDTPAPGAVRALLRDFQRVWLVESSLAHQPSDYAPEPATARLTRTASFDGAIVIKLFERR